MAKTSTTSDDPIRRHLVFGWWALAAFVTLGLVLESMHGLKVGWYLDVGNETRRLVWRLAHAHGTLFSLANLLFAFTLDRLGAAKEAWARLPSRLLIAATVLLPGGFLLGGLGVKGGDPGIGILAAPVGGLLFLAAVVLTARGATR